MVNNQELSIIVLGERGKGGRVRTEPSDPKRTKGYFRCRISIDRSSHPTSLMRRAGCHTSLGFPGRCQLLLHTIRCAPCRVFSWLMRALLNGKFAHVSQKT